MTMTAKDAIVQLLAQSDHPLAVHEIKIEGVSENSVAARLRELKATNTVVCRFREGKPFKEWLLTVQAGRSGPKAAPVAPSRAPHTPEQNAQAANNAAASNSSAGYQAGQLF
jgi:hypothetical protein